MQDADYKQQVADAFHRSAASYDRLGVDFFTPMGQRLVELARPAPGERVLDVGCGRGACVFPAAARVGPRGLVTGIDIAPGMIAEAAAEAAERGLGNVDLKVMDAESPEFPPGSFDVVTGSYSLIFLPDAVGALERYTALLAAGGRIAFTSPEFRAGTFPFLPPEFTPLIPRELLGHLPAQWQPAELVERFNSWLERAEDLVSTLEGCGYRDVVVTDETVRMTAPSAATWVKWSHTQGMALLWRHLPEEAAAGLRSRLIEGLEQLADDSGRVVIDVPVRFVTAAVRR
ncbi:class I SAM-dependent methyltransferase [Streptomyces sp. NPDC049585]|uniref:class I SAM-dependent methyltransferase n=1 Tax=Streptomyces sp. NPDC049585 TaxID=3155154 RepID=UPI0034313D77